jgi:hypothetical protein
VTTSFQAIMMFLSRISSSCGINYVKSSELMMSLQPLTTPPISPTHYIIEGILLIIYLRGLKNNESLTPVRRNTTGHELCPTLLFRLYLCIPYCCIVWVQPLPHALCTLSSSYDVISASLTAASFGFNLCFMPPAHSPPFKTLLVHQSLLHRLGSTFAPCLQRQRTPPLRT